MRTASLAALGLGTGARSGATSMLPVSPVFGRSFVDLQGQEQALSAYVGQPVLVNFWASWCGPCVREMPLLESLHQQHPDLTVLGLAIDTQANVERFLKKVQVSYSLLLTGTQGIPLMRELGNKSGVLPFTLLFDRSGRQADSVIGELKPDNIQTRLDQIL